MARFDPKAYEAAVVKPLRRWTGRELPDDLVSRYAVDLGMSDADLTQRLAEVRSHWNKSAQSTGKSATTQNLCKAFLRADEELKRAHGAELNKIAWWGRHQQARVGARQGEIDELALTLRKSFGELGLIAAGQLEATMRATFAALAPDEGRRHWPQRVSRSARPRSCPSPADCSTPSTTRFGPGWPTHR